MQVSHENFLLLSIILDIEYRFPEWDIINPVTNGSITLYISKTTGGPFFIAQIGFAIPSPRNPAIYIKTHFFFERMV